MKRKVTLFLVLSVLLAVNLFAQTAEVPTGTGTSLAACRAGITFGMQFADVTFSFEGFQHCLHGTFICFEMNGKV